MPPSKREQLIDAAMRVFYQNGFHASGIDRVLHEAGVSRMTLYNHFKSKDELVAAALRRRDEIFRNRMMKFVEAASDNPQQQILAVFDYHQQWFMEKNFCGCMFINASAEFSDPNSTPRKIAAEHKLEIIRYLANICKRNHISNYEQIAQQLSILLEGATVTARVIGQIPDNGKKPEEAAQLAKAMAQQILLHAKTTTTVNTQQPAANQTPGQPHHP